MSILEIREFIDDKGVYTKTELVNVEDEMNEVLSKVERLQAARKRSQDSSDDDDDVDTKREDDFDIEKLRSSLAQSLNQSDAVVDVS